MKLILGLIVALLGSGVAEAQQTSGDVSPLERQVLTEFFAATGGEHWTKHDGWSTSMPVCNWYGVYCDFVDGDARRPFVMGLSLERNNLDGQIPSRIGDLNGLRSLDVAYNRLSGTVPERLLQRWDNYQFEFSGDGNAFSDFVVRASIVSSSSGALCAEHDDILFRLDLDAVSRRALFQSVRCADAKFRTTFCLVREGSPASLDRLSRELKTLKFPTFESTYDYPFSAATHGTELTTTATWGDRSQKSVETYNRQGPRDVWIAQQLFLGLLTEAYWERETRKPKCDFQR